MDRFDALINKNRVYCFGIHPIVGRFKDRSAESFRLRAQWTFEEGLAVVWSESKANSAFDNNTGIELDAQSSSCC